MLRRQNLGWLMPLEHKLGLGQRPGTITLHSIQPRVLLRYFHQLSGLSGTIEVDSREYLAAYRLPCVVIDPIHPREDGERGPEHRFAKGALTCSGGVREAETGRRYWSARSRSRCATHALPWRRIRCEFPLIAGDGAGEMARCWRERVPGSVVAPGCRRASTSGLPRGSSAGGLAPLPLAAMDQRLDRRSWPGGRQGDPRSCESIATWGRVFRILGAHRRNVLGTGRRG